MEDPKAGTHRKDEVVGTMADLLPDDLGAAAHRKLSEPGSGQASAK